MQLPLKLTCECGREHEASPGASVRCACGRTYSLDVPEDAQRQIMRARHALRSVQRAGLLVMPSIGLLGFLLLRSLWGLALGPVAGVLWYLIVLKHFQRRYVEALGRVRWTTGAG